MGRAGSFLSFMVENVEKIFPLRVLIRLKRFHQFLMCSFEVY